VSNGNSILKLVAYYSVRTMRVNDIERVHRWPARNFQPARLSCLRPGEHGEDAQGRIRLLYLWVSAHQDHGIFQVLGSILLILGHV
jgi:hypothetical protein